jgi:hypothetical protein
MPALIYRVLPLAALALLGACNRGAPAASAATRGGEVAARVADRSAAPGAAATAVRTASRPADACGWISAAEVAKIVGPLTGAPRPGDDGCIYPLPVDSATARRRAQALELRRKLEERFGKSDLPMPEPDESAVIVDVQVYTGPAGERGVGAAMSTMGGWLREDSAGAPRTESGSPPRRDSLPPAPLPGWDGTNRATSRSFYGRIGHVRVGVEVQAAEVTREQTAAIANRVRDAIPDLPFPTERPYNPVGPDPCILLSVPEAEAVLGKLVVPPYRSDEETPLAMEQGRSCSYFTAGHHALVLTPTWEYGGTAFDAMRGIGGLLERVAPSLHNDAADTLDSGPWEDAAGDPGTGQLYFLKGDRLIELGYLGSSTDFDGAVRLARIVVGRL